MEAREQQGIWCYVFEIHLEMGLDCPVGPAQILFMNGESFAKDRNVKEGDRNFPGSREVIPRMRLAAQKRKL